MKKREKIRLLVDGTVDYLPGFNKKKVNEVKVHVFLNKKEVNLSKKEFYKKLVNPNNHFTTSQATPEDFLKVYNKFKDDKLIVLTVTSKLSGTYNSALAAKKASRNKNITVIDSEFTSAVLGIIIDAGVKEIRKGSSYEEVIKKIRGLIPKCRIYLVVNTLDYLVRGGRVNKALGLLGKLVNLKPVLEFKNGVLQSAGKMLLFNDLIKGFHNFIKKKIRNTTRVYMIHNNLDKETSILKNMFEKDYPVEIIHYLTPVLGVHAGPEVIAVGWVEE
jgi:DegV family protein with EDD domain